MGSRPLSGWRKVAAVAWEPPRDPQIHGDLEVDAGALLRYVEQARRQAGVRLTVNHLVVRAVALALAACPDVNGVIRRGRFVPRDHVDVFVIATLGTGGDLSGVKVEDADRKSAVDVAAEVSARAAAIVEGTDVEFGRAKRLLTWAPPWMLRHVVRAGAWLTADHGIDLPGLGLPRHPFGSAMVSPVGKFGIGHAYAPLAAMYRVPLLVLAGEVTPKPVAAEGVVVVRPMLPLAATIDHRYVDAEQAARLAAVVQDYCRDPAAYEPDLAGPRVPRQRTAAEPDRVRGGRP